MSSGSLGINPKLKGSIADLLLALLLLSPSTPPKATPPLTSDDQDVDPADGPANFVVPPADYVPPQGAPTSINDVLSQRHRTDLPFNSEADLSGAHAVSKIAKDFFNYLNDLELLDFIEVQNLDSILTTPWTKPDVWGSQVRRPITNEGCVDNAMSLNVVEPVVECLQAYLAPFLTSLNALCHEYFSDVGDMSYSIQARYQSTVPSDNKARTDIMITLEWSSPAERLTPPALPWNAGDDFLTILQSAFKEAAALKKQGSKSKRTREIMARELPLVVLHIFEDKGPNHLDPEGFTPKYQKKKGPEYNSVRAIIPQIKQYAEDFCCPYVTVSDYFSFYIMWIRPGARESQRIEKRFEKKQNPLHQPIIVNDERDEDRVVPRKLIFGAVIKRLLDMGIVIQTAAGWTQYAFAKPVVDNIQKKKTNKKKTKKKKTPSKTGTESEEDLDQGSSAGEKKTNKKKTKKKKAPSKTGTESEEDQDQGNSDGEKKTNKKNTKRKKTPSKTETETEDDQDQGSGDGEKKTKSKKPKKLNRSNSVSSVVSKQ
ncbi:hypothetical protein DL96DRAFT_1800410 [Flagelloscypha sp. PMI_526]|nr:hypothetical protein DL96DRAFT_1800410 [Flagelloscypha sp. PMI_526]